VLLWGIVLDLWDGRREKGWKKGNRLRFGNQVRAGYGMWGVGWLAGYSVAAGMEWTRDYSIQVE